MRAVLRILLIYVPCAAILSSVLAVAALRWMPVRITPLMLVRSVQGVACPDGAVSKRWIPADRMPACMMRAVVASEDNRFMTHSGFDTEEIRRMIELHRRSGRPMRGCSTISQQTARNCFTFCSHTLLRKAAEAYFTVLIEWMWPKRRIMEVYLNVIEMGRGIYGVEAASEFYFGIPASEMSVSQAVSLTCCLPSPLRRTPQWASAHMASRRAQIYDLMTKIAYPDWMY